MEKLPIRFFAKREGDDLRVEGGGGGNPPKFVLHSQALYEKSVKLKNNFIELDGVIDAKLSKSDIPIITTIKIIDEAKAKSHKKKLRNFFKVGNTNNVIGLIDDNELVVKFDSISDYRTITSRLEQADEYDYQISSIENVNIHYPKLVFSENEDDYKIRLFNFNSFIENEFAYGKLEDIFKDENIDFTKTYYTENSLVYRLKDVKKSTLDKLITLDNTSSIFSITPMPRYSVSLDSSSIEKEIEVIEPEDDKDYVVVGVLDSGIEPIPHIKNWIVKENYSAYPENVKDKSHGTFVSGIVVYGDRLESMKMTDTKMFKVLDACVYPDKKLEQITEDELISNIKAAIELYHEKVKIWTLSISVTREIVDDKFSDFAAALDELQDKYNILIIKSAGNTKNFMKGIDNGRIHEGADSVRSITVGSIAHKSTSDSLVPVEDVSPFSRIGRGPAEIIKPELVHYGGNVSKSNGKYTAIGVNSLSINGGVSQSIGTSYSTPRVAGLTADLFDTIEEEFDPLTLKALMIHSGSYSKDSKIPKNLRQKFAGFGKPKNTNEILFNDAHSSTLILRDELYKSDKIDIFDFPIPDCLIKDGYYTGNITITLVYSPIVDITQGSEYCQSDLDIKFGTYHNIKERDISKSNILNKLGRVNSENALLPKFYSKSKMKRNVSEFSLREHTLIKYNGKYYPVKKYSVSLEDVTEGNKIKHLDADRNWYLYLKGIYRDNVEYLADITGEELSQEFCLIITIKDPSKTVNVYDGVAQKLDEFNFWNKNIQVKTDVKIEV